ncbi:hypothetical protein PN36_12235 [Candidatus Thiomargarita nelsonii]|uniref:Uncharacterized protein n=1 Tax=Candidatus Thiomargarita nelsonii TaxID=1003181 RepID=A0A0A6PD73_9GAMM|nr:hypothetical protein PN36_12235 [Candidatus Thiomargarita nelsonii]
MNFANACRAGTTTPFYFGETGETISTKKSPKLKLWTPTTMSSQKKSKAEALDSNNNVKSKKVQS